MFKKFFQPIRPIQGFTLVEMIGVLAIIAILIALLLPKIFQLVASANARSLTAAVRTYETSIVNYYADIGSLYPLNAVGNPQAEGGGQSTQVRSLPSRLILNSADPLNVGTGSWPRFRGPYLEKFNSANPPGLGVTMTMPSTTANNFGAAPAFNHRNFDLDGNNTNDLANASQVAYLFVDDVTQTQFQEIDGIIDPGVGANLGERQARGRVKWRAAGGGQLLIYLANQ